MREKVSRFVSIIPTNLQTATACPHYLSTPSTELYPNIVVKHLFGGIFGGVKNQVFLQI